MPRHPTAQTRALSQAVEWLIDNLDQPQAVTAGCARMGPAVAALGVPPDRFEALSTLLVDVLRANAGPMRPEQRAAWQATGRLAARWMAQGALAAAYEPPFWTGTVVEHDQRRQDLAVLVVRTFLPYPYQSGQHAVVESGYVRDQWRPCWLATPPASDNVVELHVRSGQPDPVGAALVGRVRSGDEVRLRPAQGRLILDSGPNGGLDKSPNSGLDNGPGGGLEKGPGGAAVPSPGPGRHLLLVAEDTGVAVMRALLAELRQRRDPRPVHLLWLVNPNEEPYDLAAVSAYAGETTTVLPVGSVPELAAALAERGPWPESDVYVSGTPTGVAAALTMLAYAGVPAGRIRHDHIGPDD